MGSKITRAFTRNQRSRSCQSNQGQIRQIIQFMNLGMSVSALFCVAFLDPSNHIHQHSIYSLLVCFPLLGYLLNRTNPIFMILIASILFTIYALIFPYLLILYNLIELTFLYIFSTLAYNYHYKSNLSALKCSTIFFILICTVQISNKCSLGLK